MQDKNLVQKLLDSGAQFGHKTSKFNPEMSPYVWGVRNGMHLIDINKTAFLIDHACKQVEEITSNGGQILWVGTKRQIQKAIQAAAIKVKQPYVIHRWIGGTLTNSDQVKKAITKLLHMRDVVEKPLAHMKKKQVSMIKKDLDRLEKNVSGIVSLRTPPAALIVVDVKREITAVKEAKSCKVPVIAVVDSNSSTHGVNTVIPANDDSFKSVSLILDEIVEAAVRGLKTYYEKYPDRQKRDEAAYEKRSMPEKERKPSNPGVRAQAPAGDAPMRDRNQRGGFGARNGTKPGNNNGPRREFNNRGPRPAGSDSRPRTSSSRPLRTTSQVVGDQKIENKEDSSSK